MIVTRQMPQGAAQSVIVRGLLAAVTEQIGRIPGFSADC